MISSLVNYVRTFSKLSENLQFLSMRVSLNKTFALQQLEKAMIEFKKRCRAFAGGYEKFV